MCLTQKQKIYMVQTSLQEWNVLSLSSRGHQLGSRFFCSYTGSTHRTQLCQGCGREASRFSEDSLAQDKKNPQHDRLKTVNNKGCLFCRLEEADTEGTCMKVWQSSTNGPLVICLNVWQMSGSDCA